MTIRAGSSPAWSPSTASNGATYHIAVAGYEGATGTVVLALSPGPPLLPGPVNGYNMGVAEPVITQQPVNQIVQAGATVTLSVTATGATGYQWYLGRGAGGGRQCRHFSHQQFPGQRGGQLLRAGLQHLWHGAKRNRRRPNRDHNCQSPTKLLEDKFGDAVDLSATVTTERYRPADGGGETGGFTLSQSFSTVGATKEEGEPNHAGQPGGASYWYSYTAPPTARSNSTPPAAPSTPFWPCISVPAPVSAP